MSHRPLALRRRQLLQAAGALGGLMLPSTARGATPAEPPRRVIFVLTELGWVWRDFAMKPPGAPATLSQYANPYEPGSNLTVDTDSWEFPLAGLAESELSPILRPLHRHRAQLLALDGLTFDFVTSQDKHGDAHAKGWCAALTGYPAARAITFQKSHAARPSLDQIIARDLRQKDATLTDLVSLEYSLGAAFPFHHYVYGARPDGTAVKLPAETNPAAAFDRLFPGLGAADPVRDRQLRVVDLVGKRYEALQQRLSGEDASKLALHRDLVRDTQRRIETLSRLVCTAPGRYAPAAGATPTQSYVQRFEAFADLITVAMTCGLTRIATLQIQTPPAHAISAVGDIHHDYSHPSHPENEFKPDTLDDFKRAADGMTKLKAFGLDLVARLADRLAAIPEGSGTMLDHTAIVVMDELAHGGHGHDQNPVVILGGLGGALRPGRYIRWARNNPTPRGWGRQYVGRPHSHLLVSLARGMGVGINDLGLTSVRGAVTQGPTPRPAADIDMTGGLDRLV